MSMIKKVEKLGKKFIISRPDKKAIKVIFQL